MHKFTFFERVTYVRHASDLLNEKQQRFAPRGEAGLFGAYMRTSPPSFFIVNEVAFFDDRWRPGITRAVAPVFGTDGRPVYPLRDVALALLLVASLRSSLLSPRVGVAPLISRRFRGRTI